MRLFVEIDGRLFERIISSGLAWECDTKCDLSRVRSKSEACRSLHKGRTNFCSSMAEKRAGKHTHYFREVVV